MTESVQNAKDARRRGWRRYAGFTLIALAIVVLVIVPEWRSRDQAGALCASFAPGERIALDEAALDARVRELKSIYPTLFVGSFNPLDAVKSPDSGAVIMVHLGAFPFGRNLCVIRVDQGIVTRTETMFGADDYAWCDGDLRLVTECPG